MFIDQAKIYVKGGDGGKGCNSFYRDKYTRFAIRNGGDGGMGSDIIIRADRNLCTLLDFKYNRHFYGAHGGHGSSNNKKGKNADDIIIRVPMGTTIKDVKTGCVLRDLDQDQQDFIVSERAILPEEVVIEIARFEEAVDHTRTEIQDIKEKIASQVGTKDAQIFDAHLLVLEDSMLIDEVKKRIKAEKLSAEFVFSQVLP